MSAPTYQPDFHEGLKGLRYRVARKTLPPSALQHGLLYIFPLFPVLLLTVVWMFFVTILSLEDLGPNATVSELSAQPHWLLLAAFPAVCLVGIVAHAYIKISRALILKRRFSCEYQEATYIAGSAQLRSMALKLTDPNQFQMLIAQTEDYVTDLRYLTVMGEILEHLAPFDNHHASELEAVIARQRSEIEGSSTT